MVVFGVGVDAGVEEGWCVFELYDQALLKLSRQAMKFFFNKKTCHMRPYSLIMIWNLLNSVKTS